jgi:hypothetical protein
MGLKKGTTNNPNGRPLGALNNLAKTHRINIDKLLTDNFDRVCDELTRLRGLAFVRMYNDLLKYVVPPAQHEPEEQQPSDELENTIIQQSLKNH